MHCHTDRHALLSLEAHALSHHYSVTGGLCRCTIVTSLEASVNRCTAVSLAVTGGPCRSMHHCLTGSPMQMHHCLTGNHCRPMQFNEPLSHWQSLEAHADQCTTVSLAVTAGPCRSMHHCLTGSHWRPMQNAPLSHWQSHADQCTTVSLACAVTAGPCSAHADQCTTVSLAVPCKCTTLTGSPMQINAPLSHWQINAPLSHWHVQSLQAHAVFHWQSLQAHAVFHWQSLQAHAVFHWQSLQAHAVQCTTVRGPCRYTTALRCPCRCRHQCT